MYISSLRKIKYRVGSNLKVGMYIPNSRKKNIDLVNSSRHTYYLFVSQKFTTTFNLFSNIFIWIDF